MWSDTWKLWRRPLLGVAMLLTIGGMAVLYLRREGRHLVLKPNMIVLATLDSGGTFFRDSAYLVRLGAHEGAVGPIRIRAWYAGAGKTMLVSERAVRTAIEEMVAERRDATVQVVRGGALMRAPAPGVDVSLTLWGEGGVSSSVMARCPFGDRPARELQVADIAVSENQGMASSADALDLVLSQVMHDASQARCPMLRGRSEVRALDGAKATAATASMAPSVVTLPAPPPVAATVSAPTPQPLARIATEPLPPADGASASQPSQAVRDSSGLAYVARINAPIVQLTMQRDTMYLRVGDAQIPELALLMTGRRADGSVADRFVPLYIVENPRVAAMGAGGMRGLRAGTTRVLVRVMGSNLPTAMHSGASARFVVKVVEP